MAATITLIRPKQKLRQAITVNDVNIGVYATGGVSVTPSQLGLSAVEFAIVKVESSASLPLGIDALVYNVATSKVLVYGTPNTEVTNAVDYSALTVRIIAFGV